MAKSTAKTAKNGKVIIDYVEVKRLAGLFFSDEEIAAHLDISRGVIARHKKSDPKYQEVYERGFNKAKGLLRSKQFQLAMEGNRTMLVWLGKQYLGQTDKQELAGPGGNEITIKVVYERKTNGSGE